MTQKITDLMKEMDNIDYLQYWLEQLRFSEKYADYNPEEIGLLPVDNMLFLIPKKEKLTKPIRVIIAPAKINK